MGVITYFILCGCTPFDWDSEAKEENAAIEAIVAGDYECELIEHWENECWENFSETANTGGKGSITQWVHAEYIVGSETICLPFTQWARGGYFSKVPTKVPTR